MIAHQLDLFGGPLKPPKKIKVDDEDFPVDDPKVIAPALPEPAVNTDEVNNEEVTLAETISQEPGAFLDGELVTNDIEWTGEYEEEVEEMIESPAEIPAETSAEIPGSMVDLEEDQGLTNGDVEKEEPAFSNEAILTTELNEEPAEPEGVTVNIEEEPEIEIPQQEEEPATTPPVMGNESYVPRQRKAEDEDGLNIPPDEELFKRQYYSMRETSAMFGVNQSLLRFWENEFDILQPKKNKKGDRYFRPVDIKNLVLIYHLLRVRKFTLEGAKDYLNSHKKAADSFELVRRLEKLKSFLFELKAGL
jgi:DNA-binding transcriptional MerR regulator